MADSRNQINFIFAFVVGSDTHFTVSMNESSGTCRFILDGWLGGNPDFTIFFIKNITKKMDC